MIALLKKWLRMPSGRRNSRGVSPCRLGVERLEDRCLMTAGALDPTFGAGGEVVVPQTEPAAATALQADGKIVLAGGASVVRLTASGYLDPTFGNAGQVQVADPNPFNAQHQGVLIDPTSQKIVVIGEDFDPVLGGTAPPGFVIARFNPDGSPDRSFNGTGQEILPVSFGSAVSLQQSFAGAALQPDGKLTVAITSTPTDPQASHTDLLLFRLATTGTLDPSFGNGGQVGLALPARGYVGTGGLIVQPDGRVVLAGSASAQPQFTVIRLTPSGQLDSTFNRSGLQAFSFGTNQNNRAAALALQPDGKIVVGGTTKATNAFVAPPDPTRDNDDFALARLNPDGTMDRTFNGTGMQTVAFNLGGLLLDDLDALALQPDGKIVAAGNAVLASSPNSTTMNTTIFAVTRLNADGSPDAAFGTNGKVTLQFASDANAHDSFPPEEFVTAVALQPNGRIVLAGGSTTGSTNQMEIARLLSSDAKLVFSSAGTFDRATATWYLRSSNSPGAPNAGTFAYGAPGWTPVVGDWDGNGTATVGVFDPATATWYLKNGNTAGAPDIAPFRYGAPGWLPVVGDWHGTGHTGIGVVDPATNTWYLRDTASPGAPDIAPFRYGAPGWLPVAGDWQGRGKFAPGVFDPGSGTWYMAGPSGVTSFAYGLGIDKPVVGDWSGDGIWTVGVFDPRGNGAWLLRDSNTAGAPDIAPFAYGAPTWVPLSGYSHTAPQALQAAGGAGPGAAAISTGDLNGVLQSALGRLRQAGVSAGLVSRLASVTALLQPLAPGQLGEALPDQNTIELSPDGAGHGWFVDPTPYQDEEFANGTAYAGSPAAGREDLLTTVLHELGHIAGLPDDSGSALMLDALPSGTRRTDALNAVFAGPEVSRTHAGYLW
jgi:uncharacterized delta-60 repeat protein